MAAALGFGGGLSPIMPGTVGTAVALLALPVLAWLPFWLWCLVILSAFIGGVFICDYAARQLGQADPGAIVWDEFVGLWVAMAGLPLSVAWVIAGFVVFRILDILKPWPISVLDKQVPGGLGIMLDDLIAGVMACGILHLAMVLLR